MENPFETQATRAKRPTFLTVLCILTFIGSGWGVLGSIFNFFTADVINGDLYMETYNSMVHRVRPLRVNTIHRRPALYLPRPRQGDCNDEPCAKPYQPSGRHPDVQPAADRVLPLHGGADSDALCNALLCRLRFSDARANDTFGHRHAGICHHVCRQPETHAVTPCLAAQRREIASGLPMNRLWLACGFLPTFRYLRSTFVVPT